MKKIIAYLLIVLAVFMIYLSYQMGGLPPAITGVGFISFALVFLKDSSSPG